MLFPPNPLRRTDTGWRLPNIVWFIAGADSGAGSPLEPSSAARTGTGNAPPRVDRRHAARILRIGRARGAGGRARPSRSWRAPVAPVGRGPRASSRRGVPTAVLDLARLGGSCSRLLADDPRLARPARGHGCSGGSRSRVRHARLRLRRASVPGGGRVGAALAPAGDDDVDRAGDHGRLRRERGDAAGAARPRVLVGARRADRDHAARPLAGDAGGRPGARGAAGAGRAAARRGRARSGRGGRDGAGLGACAGRCRPGPARRPRSGRRRDRRRGGGHGRVDDHRRVAAGGAGGGRSRGRRHGRDRLGAARSGRGCRR